MFVLVTLKKNVQQQAKLKAHVVLIQVYSEVKITSSTFVLCCHLLFYLNDAALIVLIHHISQY